MSFCAYDTNNVFAKILRGELPAEVVYENNNALAFKDAFPVAPVHVLVIPKGPYRSFNDFWSLAKAEEKIDFWDAVHKTVEVLNVNGTGYRLVSNVGKDSGQEVFHFHVHIIAGKQLLSKC